MKKLFLVLILGSCLFACSKDDNNIHEGNNNDVSSFLMNNNGLQISEFVENGENKTSNFSTYVFKFDSEGSVVASNSNGNIEGTYLVFKDDGRTELKMVFPLNYPFIELTDDWYFVTIQNNIIQFSDGMDVLHFLKL
jgi:hypothetical protein